MSLKSLALWYHGLVQNRTNVRQTNYFKINLKKYETEIENKEVFLQLSLSYKHTGFSKQFY